MTLEKKLSQSLKVAEKELISKNAKVAKQQEQMKNLYDKMVKVQGKYEQFNKELMERSKKHQVNAQKESEKINKSMEDLRESLSNTFQGQLILESRINIIKELLNIEDGKESEDESTQL